jgi:CheY-like chemotaxis protein
MSPPRILVADDDAWILRMVSTVLEKRGYVVETASDGQEALQKATASRPDLLVTDVMMPYLDGWALVKALRALPEFALMPVVFLTALSSDDDRIRGFRLGADDYLAKPFRFEELDLRVAKTLRRRVAIENSIRDQLGSGSVGLPPPDSAATVQASGPVQGLAGTLDQIGLPSVLTILEMERKTGLLELTDAESGSLGRVFVRDGAVVHAELPIGGITATECVYELLRWRSGTFSFTALAVDLPDSVGATTTHLLMEGARRIDEADGDGSSDLI